MKTWYPEKSDRQNLNWGAMGKRLSEAFTQDAELLAFKAGLSLLDGVPMADLLPDDALLPDESLRYFYIDPNWTACLLDGAMSLSRTTTRDVQHDAAVHPYLVQAARLHSANARLLRFNLPPNQVPGDLRTGFMLRSQLVRGWPYLEIQCYANQAPLNLLKLDLVGESILFGIVDGELDAVELTEPQETSSFGFAEADSGALAVNLKSLKAEDVGTDIGVTEAPVFRNKDKKVLDISTLAQNMQQSLARHQKQGDYFSAVEFAVQMLWEQAQFRHNIK